MTPKALARIAATILLLLALVPLQVFALSLRLRLAATLPVRFHRLLLALIGVRVVERGRPSTVRPLLVVANHISWLDIPVLGSRAPVSFVAKSEIAGWPVFGWLARLQRTIFVERERRQRTGEAAGLMAARLKAGDRVVLFAEGTTGDGIRLLPFRSALLGAVGPALGREAWVQPLALVYTRRGGLPLTRSTMSAIAWTGDMDLLPHLLGILAGRPVEVVVQWGEPVPVSAATDRKALTKRLEGEVRRLRRRQAVIPDGTADPGSQAERTAFSGRRSRIVAARRPG